MVGQGFVGGRLDEKLREKIIAAVEKSIQIAGAKDYQSGMVQTSKLLAYFYEHIESMKTPDDLRALLDRCPPMSRYEKALALVLAQNLHHVLRLGLKAAAKKAASDLPAGGRPSALANDKALEALDYVSKLNRKGYPFEVAKSRAAHNYGCSVRTIERLWAKRESISEEMLPDVTIEDALRYLTSDHVSVEQDAMATE
jgi:hypothetical protein